MAEMILPGVYIDVRAEGLIVPGRITVSNLGVVGTASRGEPFVPKIVGSIAQARQEFGSYDAWAGDGSDLTLVRALELAFAHGATTVFAVRVTGADANGLTTAQPATMAVPGGGGTIANLQAASPGGWGNGLAVNIDDQNVGPAWVANELHDGGAAVTLDYHPVVPNARNRAQFFPAGQVTGRSLPIIYELPQGVAKVPSGQVMIDPASGALTFGDGQPPNGSRVAVSYLASPAKRFRVTFQSGRTQESYTVLDGKTLVQAIKANPGSMVAVPANETGTTDAPDPSGRINNRPIYASFGGGTNASDSARYDLGLEALMDRDAHIIVAAGQGEDFASTLDAHCQSASTDLLQRDRIGVIGFNPQPYTVASLGVASNVFDRLSNHSVDSDRLIFVGPAIQTTDLGANPPVTVTLPGSFAAAAIAGLLAFYPPHVSLTNKPLRVIDVLPHFTLPELQELVLNRVLALESRQGLRVVQGLTTSTNTAWRQITTRRIVDYAKFGVRSAAQPYIGLLNNSRVRSALRATINAFLTDMVNSEMLTAYQLDVTATRDDEKQGIARVNMTLLPVFSIDYIQVTMFLQ